MATEEPNVELTETGEAMELESRPRFRLHHFFAMTAVAAVLLAITGPQPDYWAQGDYQPPRLLLTLFTASAVTNTLLVSVAVTALAYGIAWQRRGLVFFDQPGHWLMAEIGIVGLLGLVPAIMYRWIWSMQFGAGDFPMAVMIVIGLYSLIMIMAVPLALNIYIGVKKCRETRWSVVFYLKAASNFMIGLGALPILIALAIAASRDRRQHTPRDAAHRCGVWLQLAICVLQLTIAVGSTFNMYYMFSRM